MEVILFTECNGSPGWGRDAGCYVIAKQLRQAGFKTQVVDFFSFFKEEHQNWVIDKLISQETMAIGFSSTHFSRYLPEDYTDWLAKDIRTQKNNAWNTYFPFSHEEMSLFFKKIKEKNPNVKVIVGGQKVIQKRTLQQKHPDVDYWIEGMADLSILELCEKIKKNQAPTKKRISSEKSLTQPFDFEHSSMTWDPLDHLFAKEALPLEISRGCPFNCSFCDYRKKGFGELIKNEDILKKELIDNYERFGINHYMITDFLVNESIEKTKMIHRVFTSLPFNIEWSGFGRLDLLAKWPEMIDLIQESGARSVMWGIESIQKEIGKNIGKLTDLDQLLPLLEKCKEKWKDDIITGSGFIIGLPGETYESADNTLNWILNSRKYLHGFEVTPLFIGSYTESKSQTIDYAEIQKNPSRYGYDVFMTETEQGFREEWVINDTGFRKTDAIKLIEKYQADPRWRNDRLIGTYHNYSRFRNLGLTHQEVLNLVPANTDLILKSRDLYFEKANQYFKSLGIYKS